ncbi:MAG: XrtA system polysaccharide deacetylase [Pseudomonadota bacterium]
MSIDLPTTAIHADEGKPRQCFAMSVDVEDYLHTLTLAPVIQRDSWDLWPSRVEAATMRIIDMFDQHQIRATFFMLGWVAKKNPNLVREIAARGHEVASRSFHHDRVHDLTPHAFREDARSVRLLLEDLSGCAVRGFRAPSFSIGEQCLWAYDQLIDAGYSYSSSVHPIHHGHFSRPAIPLQPFRPNDSDFLEIPVATVKLFGCILSCAGSAQFRLMPYRWSKWCLERLATDLDRTVIFYFHPWEIDPDQPRLNGLSLRTCVQQYIGLAAMEKKLKRLVTDFHWDRIDRLCRLDEPNGTETKAVPS